MTKERIIKSGPSFCSSHRHSMRREKRGSRRQQFFKKQFRLTQAELDLTAYRTVNDEG